MMMRIKKVLIFLVLTFNIVLTQYPSASFESDEYSIGEHLENYSVTLEINNPDLLELWAYTIYLYADTSIIKLTDATWHSGGPFQYTNFDSNAYNDTLKISAYTASTGEMYSGEGGGILDISFDIVGEAGESTLLEFIRFEISDSYIENTTPTNIILVKGVDCNDPTACNYNVGSSSDIHCIPIPEGECCIVDDCSGQGDCDGNVDLGCGCGEAGPSGCDDECGSIAKLDECGVCDGDNSLCSDCAGNPNGNAYITPCGDCSFDEDGQPSTCDISDISVSVETMDNNFRSNNIEIPISLSNYEYIGPSESESAAGLEGLQGLRFIISYEPDTLFFDASKSKGLIENFGYFFSEESTGEIMGILYHAPLDGCDETDSCGEIYSWDGPFASLSFDIIESKYNPELHGSKTDVGITLIEVDATDVSLSDTGSLTIFTRACIDPFASTFDSNFICDCTGGNEQCENDYNDVCDNNGIIEGSNILNDGCILPEPDFENILVDRLDENNITTQEKIVNVNYGTCSREPNITCYKNNDCIDLSDAIADTICNFNYFYTLTIPEATTLDFPIAGEPSLDIRSSPVDIIYLPDVAPGAQLAGSLVGLYPFGTTFDPPVEFIFTFADLTRGTSEYKILYMDCWNKY